MEIRTYPIYSSFQQRPRKRQDTKEDKKEKEPKKEQKEKSSDIFERKIKEDELL